MLKPLYGEILIYNYMIKVIIFFYYLLFCINDCYSRSNLQLFQYNYNLRNKDILFKSILCWYNSKYLSLKINENMY